MKKRRRQFWEKKQKQNEKKMERKACGGKLKLNSQPAQS
jgi:hypothetical protein